MKVLLDEMLPVGVTDLLSGQMVTTVKAAADGYDVLVTADRNLPAQQNIRASGIAVVLVTGNRLVEIEPNAGAIREAIETAEPGTVTCLGRPT